jgi:capsular polysaccharide biosynthesis protein
MSVKFSNDIGELLASYKHVPDLPVREHKRAVGRSSTFCAQFISKNNILNVVYLGRIDIGWINHVLGHCHRQRKALRLFVGLDISDPNSAALLDNLMLISKELEITNTLPSSLIIASTESLFGYVEELGLPIDFIFMTGFTLYSPLKKLLEQFECCSTLVKPIYCGDNFFVAEVRRAINDHCINVSQIVVASKDRRIFIASTDEKLKKLNGLETYPTIPLSQQISTNYVPLNTIGWDDLKQNDSDDFGLIECKLLLDSESSIEPLEVEILLLEGMSNDKEIVFRNQVMKIGAPIYGGVFYDSIINRADEFLALKNQSILKSSIGMAKPSEGMRILSSYQTELELVPGRTILLSGPAHNNYYHWLVDCLPKMMLAEHFMEDADAVKFAIPVGAFQKESLSILGVPREKIVELDLKRGYRFEQCVFIDRLSGNGWELRPSLGKFLKEFGKKALNNASHNIGNKRRNIYIDRRSASARKIVNEDYLVKELELLGFEIVQLEKLTITQQIVLFSEVGIVVAPHGAGLTNLIFCKGEVSVIEIFSEIYINSCFWHLCSMSDATFKWQSIIFPCPHFSEEKRNFSFHVDILMLTKIISRL